MNYIAVRCFNHEQRYYAQDQQEPLQECIVREMYDTFEKIEFFVLANLAFKLCINTRNTPIRRNAFLK